MTSTSKIHQLLKEIKTAAGKTPRDIFYFLKADQALALLPCETCNGTKQVPTPQSIGTCEVCETHDLCNDVKSVDLPIPKRNMMLYAEIKVKIYVDEDKLTPDQQIQASKSDADITIDHPLDEGVTNLRGIIEDVCLPQFIHLGKGVEAVKIEIE